MRTHLFTLTLASTFSLMALTSCNNNDTAATVVDPATTVDQDISTATPPTIDTANDSTVITDIDWSKVASGVQAADRASYDYPFAVDSQNVQDYADYFEVDKATAQHNLTVGMASNEALSKVLDQLSNSYTSHELTDGETVELIIHTIPEVNASRYDYVFEEDFAKGLMLPIVIQPDGKKDETVVNPHEELGEQVLE